MAKGRGYCIFCQGTGLSREHIWPQWASKYIPASDSGSHVRHTIVSSAANPWIPESHEKQNFQGDVKTVKIRVVCRKHCNNGWMSRLESAVKPILTPMLLDESIVLSPDDQRTLAAWITMKLMVAEFTRPTDVVTRLDQRTSLMRSLIPPSGWTIWIGRRQARKWRSGYWRHAATIGLAEQGQVPLPPMAPVEERQCGDTRDRLSADSRDCDDAPGHRI